MSDTPLPAPSPRMPDDLTPTKDWKARWAIIKHELQEELDELEAKVREGKAEAREEWVELKAKYQRFTADFDDRKDQAEDILEDSARKVVAELREGALKLRGLFR